MAARLPALLALAGALAAHPAAAAPGAADALGEQVAQGFCFACHDRGSGSRALNPLFPKLSDERFGTPERAYQTLGRLGDLNPLMILPFQGTEQERRALAAWLADQAERNRPPWWQRSPLAAALLGGLAVAGLWALWWSRQRRRA